jgi:PAS domain S-box-containing protein
MPDTPWRAFAAAALIAAVAASTFTVWMGFQLGGETTTVAVDDIGEAVAALVAALACGFAARRAAGRLRTAWLLLAASAASWCAGEAVWSIYEVGLGVPVPVPSAADMGFLAAVPLAVAGILSFSTSPRGTSTRWRVWLDGLIIAVSLSFVAWTSGLSQVYGDRSDPLLERMINLAYPLGDILVGTVLILAIRRAAGQQTGRLILLLGGLAANSIADSAFAYLTASGNYGVLGSTLDAGWVIGYLMIALAAFWPSRPIDVSVRAPIDIWQVAVPWVAVLAAGIAAVVNAGRGNSFDAFMSLLAGTLVILLMFSQFLAHRDALSLLIKSLRSEAIIAEVIANAPSGVVRLGTDLSIWSTNPRFDELIGQERTSLVGAHLSSFVAGRKALELAAKFQLLCDGHERAIEGDDEITRRDGATVWLHWSSTAVRTADGSADYFVALFEDSTARHKAEQATAAYLAAVERLNDLKGQFLQTARHEFRTALVGIQGFSELIRDVENLDTAEVKEFATDIYEGARRLDQMIGEMLTLERGETAGTVLDLAPTDVNGLVKSVVEEMRATCGQPAIFMSLDAQLPSVPADAKRLDEVMRTLVRNAIRYSPDDGQILISTGNAGDDILVTVKDQGVGVRADFANRLLGDGDLYGNNAIRKLIGTGLGLEIAREIVELHGGRMWIERIDGIGSHVHFTLPAHPATIELDMPVGMRNRRP